MLLFLLAASVVYIALAAWSHAARPEWMPTGPALIWTLVGALPVLALWCAAECVRWLTPRRVLDGRVHAPAARVALGLLAGVLGGALSVLGVVFLSGIVPDATIMAAGAPAGGALVLLCTARTRAGRCVHCGYDLSGNTVRTGGRCAECGANLI